MTPNIWQQRSANDNLRVYQRIMNLLICGYCKKNVWQKRASRLASGIGLVHGIRRCEARHVRAVMVFSAVVSVAILRNFSTRGKMQWNDKSGINRVATDATAAAAADAGCSWVLTDADDWKIISTNHLALRWSSEGIFQSRRLPILCHSSPMNYKPTVTHLQQLALQLVTSITAKSIPAE